MVMQRHVTAMPLFSDLDAHAIGHMAICMQPLCTCALMITMTTFCVHVTTLVCFRDDHFLYYTQIRAADGDGKAFGHC